MLALCRTFLPHHHQHRQTFNMACASSWVTTTEEKLQSVRRVITAPASVMPQACIYNRLSIDGDDEK